MPEGQAELFQAPKFRLFVLVPSVDDVYERAQQRGVHIVASHQTDKAMFQCLDPDGNLVEVRHIHPQSGGIP